MSKQFQFADFVEEFSVPIIAKTVGSDGYYDDGEWVPPIPAEDLNLVAIVLPLSEDDLKYVESGSYTVKEKKLYVTKELAVGQKIEYKSDLYEIGAFKDYSEYADVYIYLMRWQEK